MARIEKTVFISYRRTDVYTALAVYENLKNRSYDVFFDYQSISSGDFEQIITSNIRARAHFLLILTPTALDRCNEPGDWLRREIEIAIEERRNIVPLFFRGFQFGYPAVEEKLTGKLNSLSRYNGLNVHEDYFDEAMQRLRTQYLNIPLNTVLHPVSTEVRKVVREEQIAADKALEKDEIVQELVKQAKEKPVLGESDGAIKNLPRIQSHKLPVEKKVAPKFNPRLLGGVASALLFIAFCLWGGANLFRNLLATPESTQTLQPTATRVSALIQTVTPAPTDMAASSTAERNIGSTRISNKDGMTMVYVPAGEFIRGSNDGDPDEKPVHTINQDAFWIDQTEVTNAMYATCVLVDECDQPSSVSSDTHQDYFGNLEFDNYPMINISWEDAKTYCLWANRRLPTEAEWEKAASWNPVTNQKYVYPWGDDTPNNHLLNYKNATGDTTEVGAYPNGASPYGVLDIAGNVWEWTADWYGETYYASSPVSNPPGPNSGQYRVLRGGAWIDDYDNVRSTDRNRSLPWYTYDYIGFRCAMDATP
jgi:formylglycine-generating enzyme required for sulfatase activity